jgi:hypothetical protein
MSEPRRLLSSTDDELSPLGRSLLLAGRGRRETDDARERVLRGVVGAAATAAALSSATRTTTDAPAAVKAAGLALTKTKLVLLGAVLVASTATVAAVVHRNGSSAAATNAAAPVAPNATSAPKRVEVSDEPPAPPLVRADMLPSASVTTSTRAVPAKTDGPRPPRQPLARAAEQSESADVAAPEAPEPSGASALLAEAEQLKSARVALGRGDAGAAMRILEDARRRFGAAGRLGEERDALEARAAFASGDRDRAAALAGAFLNRYPKSPLRSSIEPLATPTPKSSPSSKIE